MYTKSELQKMKVTELVIVANKFHLSTDCTKSQIIEAILKAQQPEPVKKTRGPRHKANTKLKALRVGSALTQLEVATRAGLNLRTYQYYEQGNKPIEGAKLETLLKICLALNCKLDEIIEDENLVEIITEYQK